MDTSRTKYLVVTRWRGVERELWEHVKDSMTSAEIYIQEMEILFPDFQYEVKLVTAEECAEYEC